MIIRSTSENKDIEKRIAITPEITKKYINLGFQIQLIKNYGTHIGFNDSQFKDAGAKIINDEKELLNNSNIVVQLNLPKDNQHTMMKENQILIGTFNAYQNKEEIYWIKPVHEQLKGYTKFANLPAEERFALYHPKDIGRQERQNAFYETI